MRLLLVGASGHAKVVVDSAERDPGLQLVGFLDGSREAGSHFLGYPLLGGDEDLKEVIASHRIDSVVVAIGDNSVRARVADRILSHVPGTTFATIIHPSAQIGSRVSIGAGTVVMAGAVVNAGTEIGEHCIINTRASVDHDCRLGSFSSMAPGATLGGSVIVGMYGAVSLGASVIHGVSIGDHTVIGAGAAVISDIPSHSVAVGVPARVIRPRQEGERYL